MGRVPWESYLSVISLYRPCPFLFPTKWASPAYLMISKKAPGFEKKLKDLNAGFEKIRANGVFKKILKKHGGSLTNHFPDE